ncbi:MAG: hypothetical protein ACYTAF_16910 [Planctomycetota bacterium]
MTCEAPRAVLIEGTEDRPAEPAEFPIPPEPVAAFVSPHPPLDPLAYLDREIPLTLHAEADPYLHEVLVGERWVDSVDVLPVDLCSDWAAEVHVSAFERVADAVFSVPEAAVDGAAELLRTLRGRENAPVYRVGGDEDASITARLFDIEQTRPRLRRPFRAFMRCLIGEEGDFFGDFRSSEVNTMAFEEGYQDADMHDLEREQVKVLFDALKATYFKKYSLRGNRHIRSDRMYFNQWRGVDFAVMPALLGGYAFYRGLEKKSKMGDTRLRVYIEPVRRIRSAVRRGSTRSALVGLDFEVPHVPFRVIVSAGTEDGGFGVDFVGIGSGFGQVRQTLAFLDDEY